MAFQVFDPCRPPVCFHEAQSLHLRYGPSVALPTLNSCRCLHEPKARFPVEWLFSLPGRELHPLEAPGLSWRTEVAAQVRIDHLAMAAVDQGVHLPDGVQTATPRSVPILLRRQIGLENRTQDQHCRRLDHSVAHRRDAQRPLTSARLRDVDPANRLRSIPLLSELSRQFAQPCFPALRLDVREPLAVHPRRSAVGGTDAVGVVQDVFSVQLVVEQIEAVARRFLRFGVQRRLQLPDFFWRLQAHATLHVLASSALSLNRGPFAPPALPGFLATTGLSATPNGPA